jgi:ribosomal protein S27E
MAKQITKPERSDRLAVKCKQCGKTIVLTGERPPSQFSVMCKACHKRGFYEPTNVFTEPQR